MECLKNFRQECKDALIAMTRKIAAIPALSSPFLRGCGSLTPEVVASGDTTRSSKLMSVALTELIKLKWIEGGDADQLLRQFTELIRRHTVQELMKNFKRSDRMDDLYVQIFRQEDVPESLQNVIRLILCLSHGQASVERGFSVNKALLVPNLLEKSLIAYRHVRDFIEVSCDSDLRSFKVDSQLLQSTRSARARHKAFEAQQKEKTVSSEQEEMKRRKREQTAELEAKRRRLLKALAETESMLEKK